MKQILILSFLLYSLACAAQDTTKHYPLLRLEACHECPIPYRPYNLREDRKLLAAHGINTHMAWNHWLWPLPKVMLSTNESGREYRQGRRQYNRLKRSNERIEKLSVSI